MASGDELKMPSALVVPGSGQGHVNPCMLLARSLAAQGFEVRFIYFSSAYAKLKAQKRLVEPSSAHSEGGGGPFSQQTTTTHSSRDYGNAIAGSGGNGGGAKDTATTASSLLSTVKSEKGLLHIHVVEDGFSPGDTEKIAFVTPAMKENLLDLIFKLREQGRPLTCLVADSFLPWTADVAERAGIPFISFWPSNAISYFLMHHTPRLFAQGIFPEKGSGPTQQKSETPLMLDLIPGLPPFPSEMYPPQVRFADASNPLVSLLCEVDLCVKRGKRMLIHTFSELEPPNAFRALQVAAISNYAIGPLIHYAEKQEITTSLAQVKENALQPNQRLECIAWLDTQAQSSVMYIAFGSYKSISAEDIQELAFGLEACGNPFLWVIRDDLCGGEGLQQVLPNGLLDRITKNGMIINWAPQVEVLAHSAIGGFFTHCGWNSTLESLWEGVPMLCCPIASDQLLNAHYICNLWGVGLDLGRTDTGGIERGSVEVGVKGLMGEEKGMKARGKAKEMMQLARKTCQQGGQSFSNLQKFYEDMKELC